MFGKNLGDFDIIDVMNTKHFEHQFSDDKSVHGLKKLDFQKGKGSALKTMHKHGA